MQGDVNWNTDDGTLGLKAIFGVTLGILQRRLQHATTSSVNSSSVNRDLIPRTELNSGTLVGIFTADGHRGIMQVNAVSDTQISPDGTR